MNGYHLIINKVFAVRFCKWFRYFSWINEFSVYLTSFKSWNGMSMSIISCWRILLINYAWLEIYMKCEFRDICLLVFHNKIKFLWTGCAKSTEENITNILYLYCIYIDAWDAAFSRCCTSGNWNLTKRPKYTEIFWYHAWINYDAFKWALTIYL